MGLFPVLGDGLNISIDSFGGSLQSVFFGEQDTLDYIIFSDGILTASIPVSFYVSDDDILDAGDQLLGTVQAEFNGSSVAVADLIVPAQAVEPGRYNLIVVAEVPPELNDTDPTDNIRTDISYSVSDARPDITVTGDASQTAEGRTGQDVSYEVTITNNGIGAVSGVLYMHFSEDGVFDEDDRYITFEFVRDLEPGESRTVDLGRELTQFDPTGSFTVFAEFTPDFDVELDKSDNTAAVGTIDVLEPQPDLSVFSMTPLTVYSSARDLAVWLVQFQNNGGLEYSGSIDVSIYASEDAVLDENDVLLTSVTSAPFQLAAGDSTFLETSYSDPSLFYSYYLEGTINGHEVYFIADVQPTAGSGGQDFDLSNNMAVRAWSDSPINNEIPFIFSGDAAVEDGSNVNDWIIGRSVPQVLSGRAGNDQINGEGGDDTIDGGPGNDSINGGTGADQIDGGDGIDLVFFATNSGRILVDLQTDVSGAGFARFFEHGAAEGDTYTGIENVRGAEAADNLRGNSADNVLEGRGVSDRLYGRAGDDTLDGGTGADALYGNRGADVMTGGDDAGRRDRFIYFSADESGVGDGARDVITDFVSDEDRIELSRIDADVTLRGKQGFDFIGDTAFSGTAGELRYEQVGGNTIVQADRDGDGAADFEIELTGTMDLTESDFLI